MSRSKTTSRVFRLACGCVTEFSSLPAVGDRLVLCASCGRRTTIAYRYATGTCGATCRTDRPEGGITRVRCTLVKRHEEARHLDESAGIEFTLPGRLRSGREGVT